MIDMAHLDVPAILRDAGLRVQVVAEWETRAQPGSFTPGGSIVHDTVGAGPTKGNAPSLAYIVANGLSQFVVGYDGLIYVCSVGRQWHAGNGFQNVRLAAHAGEPIPAPAGTEENANTYWWGWETENRGLGSGEHWTAEQHEAVARGCAALHEAKGYPPSAVVGHFESAGPRKVDPWSVNMAELRTAVIAAATEASRPTILEGESIAMGRRWNTTVVALTTDASGRGWAETKIRTDKLRVARIQLSSKQHPTRAGNYDQAHAQALITDLDGWGHVTVTDGAPHTGYAIICYHE